MLFSSPFFIFIFLPIFFIIFLSFGKYRDAILLIASFSFYCWGEPVFSFIALASALFDYFLARKINHYKQFNYNAKFLLFVGIAANLILLIYFKYTNFLLDNIRSLFTDSTFETYKIILPIGISFIVFEKITYLVDIYRGVGHPAANIFKYLTYVFLFPKLLAGPIIKYHEIESQLHARSLSLDDIFLGFQRFIRGIIKKVLLADTFAEIVNPIFAMPDSQLSFHYAWLGVICFSFQIYFDFSGYSDMAIGLARMMGFRLRENFNMPYIASSFTEFWRRWHISLSTWIREYLYLPLGGNRVSTFRMYANLWICFLLSGLWHGANWTFVLWGAYNGLFLVLDKIFWLKIENQLPKLLTTALTFFFIMIGWVIFRAKDLSQFKNFMYVLFHPSIQTAAYIDITNNIEAAIIIGFLLSLFAVMPFYQNLQQKFDNLMLSDMAKSFIYGCLGFFAICKLVSLTFNPFLYFRF